MRDSKYQEIRTQTRDAMRSQITLAFVCAVAVLSIIPASATAWGNGGFSADPTHPDYGIHDWIADKALSFQTANVQFLLTTYHAKYLIGTEAPDNGAYIGDSFNHHVYYTTSGSVQSDVGAARARSMFQAALTSLRSSDFENAAYYAGAMAHYISDLGAYGHTMGSSAVWGTSPHHGDYEDHVQTLLGSLVAPAPATLTRTDAYNSTLALARETTFGSGAIMANIWMEANYNWGNPTFRASCLESLNESVRAVARALCQLLFEAGLSPVPEFGFFEAVLVVAVTIPMAVCARINNRKST
jgi:hypothetical protein